MANVSQLTSNGTCLSDTSVQVLQMIKECMWETGHAPKSVPVRIIFASIFHDITNWESQKVQDKSPAQAKEVATYAARFGPCYWCFCGPGSEVLEIQ